MIDDDGSWHTAPELNPILNSPQLEAWYWEGHYTINQELIKWQEAMALFYNNGGTPEKWIDSDEYYPQPDKRDKIILIYYFTNATNITDELRKTAIFEDGDVFNGEVNPNEILDDTIRFEIDSIYYQLKVTKGELADDLKGYLESELMNISEKAGLFDFEGMTDFG